MTNGLGDLYQEVIIDHSRHPHNFRRIEDATETAEGMNPLCGDQLTLYVKVVDGRIDDISFEGAGCAISLASASLMTAEVKGKETDAAIELFDQVHDMLTESDHDHELSDDLGSVAALSGVAAYPMRVKCATLAWHTLKSALDSQGEPATTE